MSGADHRQQWRTSTRCESGACIEVMIEKDRVTVRRSTDPHGARLTFSPAAWAAFLDAIRSGSLDR
jgi:hypothetical protein